MPSIKVTPLISTAADVCASSDSEPVQQQKQQSESVAGVTCPTVVAQELNKLDKHCGDSLLRIPPEEENNTKEQVHHGELASTKPVQVRSINVAPRKATTSIVGNSEPAQQVYNNDSNNKYDGDIEDDTPLLELAEDTYKAIAFVISQWHTGVDIAMFFYDAVRTGKKNLHKWQIETLEEICNAKPTDQEPYRLALCAANGSGKDYFVIAPFVVWFALTKQRSLSVITSASGPQLTAQTENHIATLCQGVNSFFRENFNVTVFKVTKRFIKCLLTGSEVRLFATDEAGRAEGYHPLEPGAEMAIIVNEAKTVAPEIFGALSRCTGYNYWLNVSTPGEAIGDFYDSWKNWHRRKVTAFDCPHLSLNHIREMARKYGENNFIYRSQILAEFTNIAGQCVIPQAFLDRCIEASIKGLIKPVKIGRKKIGADLAAGRDECVFICVHGNTIVEIEAFVESDTTETERRFEAFILKHGGNDNCDVFADDGGLGHAIIDRMVKKGYNINRVLNQSRAIMSGQFGNRGAENWFNVSRLIEECVLYLPLKPLPNSDDLTLYDQLCYRHYKKQEILGRISLESKKTEKDDYKVKSPDRADALVLALCDTRFDDLEVFKTGLKKEVLKPKDNEKLYTNPFDMYNDKFAAMRSKLMEKDGEGKGNVNSSLECLLAAHNN